MVRGPKKVENHWCNPTGCMYEKTEKNLFTAVPVKSISTKAHYSFI